MQFLIIMAFNYLKLLDVAILKRYLDEE